MSHTRQFNRTKAAPPQAGGLLRSELFWREVGRLAVDMGPAAGDDLQAADARRLRVGEVRFDARAHVLSQRQDRAIVVVVLRETDMDVYAAARELRRRHGLTAREAEVALLLAERRTSKEIARLLGITVHTAMRHTEKVLAKLGLGCRRHVAAVVAGAVALPEQPVDSPAEPAVAVGLSSAA